MCSDWQRKRRIWTRTAAVICRRRCVESMKRFELLTPVTMTSRLTSFLYARGSSSSLVQGPVDGWVIYSSKEHYQHARTRLDGWRREHGVNSHTSASDCHVNNNWLLRLLLPERDYRLRYVRVFAVAIPSVCRL